MRRKLTVEVHALSESGNCSQSRSLRQFGGFDWFNC